MTDQQQPHQVQQPQQPQQVQPPMQPMQPMQVPIQPVQMVQPQPPQPPQMPQMPQPVISGQPPQHTPAMDPNASIIDQLRAQNAALMQRNDELNAQVVRMVQGGAQFQQAQQPMQPMQPAQHVPAQYQQTPEFPNYYEPYQPPISLTQPVDYSMESLGREIGKKENDG